jgi:ferritin-like metal-binding protein YciE
MGRRDKKIEAKDGAAKSLDGLFRDGLRDIYWAEKAILNTLPAFSANASSRRLSKVINQHLSQSKRHTKRLQKVFKLINEKPEARKCEAMDGILDEGLHMLEQTKVGATRDAGIIAACQKVEHYEITTYGSLASWAKSLENKKAARLLAKNLSDEKDADKKLARLARKKINVKADIYA